MNVNIKALQHSLEEDGLEEFIAAYVDPDVAVVLAPVLLDAAKKGAHWNTLKAFVENKADADNNHFAYDIIVDEMDSLESK